MSERRTMRFHVEHDDALDAVVGYRGMAEMLGVGSRAPAVWRQRKQLPVPDFEEINGSPAWYRTTVIRWAVDTGRCERLVHASDRAMAERVGS